MSKEIESSIQANKWKRARRQIRAALSKNPRSHWLLTRLGLTFYEQRDYARALGYSKKALSIAPRCPLALWDYAGAHQMLGRHRQALQIYQSLVRRGVSSPARGQCGEGLARARGLRADCLYRWAQSLCKLGRKKQAIKAYRHHLRMRGPGCHSIYPIAEVRRELAKLTVSSS